MTEWQKRFAQKVDLVHESARDQFEELADGILVPTFEEFREFTSAQGFCATAPLKKPGIRAFKFAVTENAYVLMTFRLAGFEHCEMQAESFVPAREKLAATPCHVELPNFDVGWARRMFEQHLDQFMDSFLQSLAEREEELAETVEA